MPQMSPMNWIMISMISIFMFKMMKTSMNKSPLSKTPLKNLHKTKKNLIKW